MVAGDRNLPIIRSYHTSDPMQSYTPSDAIIHRMYDILTMFREELDELRRVKSREDETSDPSRPPIIIPYLRSDDFRRRVDPMISEKLHPADPIAKAEEREDQKQEGEDVNREGSSEMSGELHRSDAQRALKRLLSGGTNNIPFHPYSFSTPELKIRDCPKCGLPSCRYEIPAGYCYYL